MQRDETFQTIKVAGILCLVCSLMISTAAVVLRPMQEKNRQLDVQLNILRVAGIVAPTEKPGGNDIAGLYQDNVTEVWVDLDTGRVVTDESDVDEEQVVDVSEEEDAKQAGIQTRPVYTKVFQINGEDGQLAMYVFPVEGKGLWSTLKGFLAIGSDLKTIKGITFYSHAETPGLGGEVDNQRWKDLWPGKLAFDDDNHVAIQVIKGSVGAQTPDAEHKVDGLSGATITSKGVTNLVRFWLGEHGFGPYLEQLRGDSKLAMTGESHGR